MTAGASAATRELQVTPLTGTIGAELSGVDLAGDLDDATIADIRAALLKHRAVFFRGQDLDYEQQVAFASRFGKLTLGHPTIKSPEDKPLMEEVDSATNAPAADWHTDVTFLDQPVSFTFLHGKVMPAVGGDTVWANTVNAYKYYLSPELRAMADGLRVIHTNAPKDARIDAGYSNPDWEETSRQFVSTIYRAEHSLVTVHPETGERALLLGGFAHRVVGLPADLSRALIRTLQEYVTRPENTVRWHWRVGDLAIWDNRATQHCAVVDYGRARRRAERVTVAGATPVGIDGRLSVSLKGDASTFYAGT
jgi:taurine dioxygenase